MHKNILDTLLTLYDTTNQLNILYKEEFGDVLAGYSYTEMHCVDSIGNIENPNVTKIARRMNLTKAAISKIIKRLIDKNAIEIYKNPDNKKETYYKLTKIGREVFDKHLIMHNIWYLKDGQFFKEYSQKDLKTTYDILHKYTNLLQKRLENIKENLK